MSPADAAGRLFSQLEAGHWQNLGAVEGVDLARRPDRSELALVRVAHRLHAGELASAREAATEALRWGVDRRLLSRLLAAAIHEDLAAAHRQRPDDERADAHRARSVDLLAAMSSALPQEGMVRTEESGDSYRAEVIRQRKLIAELRAAIHARKAHDDVADQDAALIARILSQHLTYLSPAKLACVARTCRAIDEQRIPGVFLEAGCALGGSAILIAVAKRPERELQVYDVFGMIPAPGEHDTPDVHARYQRIVEGLSEGIEGDRYYGYEANLFEVVRRNLQQFKVDTEAQHVRLIKGLVQDTLVGTEPVALAHIDLDWFEPVDVCLRRIHPRLSIGGSIIVDDYHDWGGCRKAVDAFLQEVGGSYVADDTARSLKLTKLKDEASP